MTSEVLGAYIRAVRERNGFSTKQLAAKVGVSVRSVERWEGGGTTPGLADSHKLARALRVPLAKLARKLGGP